MNIDVSRISLALLQGIYPTIIVILVNSRLSFIEKTNIAVSNNTIQFAAAGTKATDTAYYSSSSNQDAVPEPGRHIADITLHDLQAASSSGQDLQDCGGLAKDKLLGDLKGALP